MVSIRNAASQGSGHGQLGPTENEPITRAIIAEEVTKAIQAAIPAFFEQMNGNTRKIIEDRIMAEKKYFSKYKLAEFTFPELREICDPIVVMRWIREMESIFDATKCADVDKVVYAVAMMKAEALIWWDMVKETSGPETAPKMTWSQFKQVFKKKLFPRSMMFQLERELMTLKQESQTVREYTTRFLELASVANDLVVTEEMKIDIYVRGLNPDIGMFMFIGRKWTKLEEAVRVAIDLENGKNCEFEEWDMVKETSGPETAPKMTWNRFKEVFKKKLFPRSMMFQLERELMTLKQESQTVREYTTRFLELASVANDLVVTEEMKIDIYVRGLNPDIGMFMFIGRKWTKLEEAVRVAIDLENGKNCEFEEWNNLKRKREDSESTTCTNCGKLHEGECRYGSKRCYRWVW